MVSLRSSSSDSASDGRRSRNSQLEPDAWSLCASVRVVVRHALLRCEASAMRWLRPRLLCFKFEHLKALRPAGERLSALRERANGFLHLTGTEVSALPKKNFQSLLPEAPRQLPFEAGEAKSLQTSSHLALQRVEQRRASPSASRADPKLQSTKRALLMRASKKSCEHGD